MRLLLREEYVECDMKRQCKDLETLWSFAIEIIEIIRKMLLQRRIRYTLTSN